MEIVIDDGYRLVSVTPMLNYDLTLNRILNLKVSKRELLESSWIVNTINNIGGFGGLVSMGLRSEFYGNKTEEKKILPALTHILLFVLSGLSIYSILCFFLFSLIQRWLIYSNIGFGY